MIKPKPSRHASPRGSLRNTHTSHGRQRSRLRWRGQGRHLTCLGPLPGGSSGRGRLPGSGCAHGSGRRTRRRPEAAHGAECKGRPEVARQLLAGRGRGQAAPRGSQPIGEPGGCARRPRPPSCGRAEAKGRARRGRRRPRYGVGPRYGGAARPGRGGVGSWSCRGGRRLSAAPGNPRPPAAAWLPPSPGRCCVRSPARGERGVASVTGQGHRAPPENGTRVSVGCLPVLGRAPRLLPGPLHRSGTRKDDLGFSSLCQ